MQTPATQSRLYALTKWCAVALAAWVYGGLNAGGQPDPTLAQTQAKSTIKSWSMADGLPHLSVTSLAQTRDGYIWVGTLAGLARFDGVRFKVFTPQNCPELPKSRIGGLFEGADGTLFIATERGGGLVGLRGGRFERLLGSGHEQDEIVTCLNERSGDSLLVARSGALWRWTGGSLTEVSTNRAFYPVSPSHVCQDERGTVWMVSRVDEPGRLLRLSSGRLESIALQGALAGGQIHAIAQDKSGRVWLGTSRGLAVLQEDRFESVELPELGTKVDIRDLAACRDGGLWVCRTNYWQRKYKAGRWVGPATEIAGVQTSLQILGEDRRGNLCLGRYPEGLVTASTDGLVARIDSASGLPGATVSCYLEDREGNEWLGLFDGGLVRLQPRRLSILGGSALTTPVYSICEAHDASIWVGTSFGGVYRFQGTNTTRYGASDLPLTDIWSLFEDSRSNLWVGTSSHGVYQFHGDHCVPMFDRARISDRVDAIYEDPQGRIWFGHWSGLACYANGQLTKMSMPWFSDEYEVVAIVADRQDRLWLGTKGAGLFCLHDGKFTAYTTANGLLSNLAWSLFVDHDDRLWVGTADGGLSCLHDGKFANFTTRDGLADETVCHIIEDSRRRLWLSSPHGIFSVDKTALESFARGETGSFSCASFDQSDGMLSAACTCAFQPSGCLTRDGRLLFPTLKGVVVVGPEAVEANTLSPPVLIEEVTVDGKPYSLAGPATIIAPAGKTRLGIRYTALSFSAPEKVRFKYRMEGLDSAWVDGGTKRIVDYSYLPHGRYKFQVQACNNDGAWSTQGAKFELIIPPHFWQTWWFVGTALLSSGAGIAFAARRIENVKAQRRLERQQQAHLVELERARIARDFHDDIGSCLTHVIVLSELVKGDKSRPTEVEAHAAMIGNTARNAVRGLGTIIWAVNPRNDTLDSLVQYISQYSYDFFQATPICCHLDLPAEVPPVPLTAEVRHNLFMVIKEALNNILKHSQASEARLWLRLQDGVLEIRVEDNGRGFNVGLAAASQRSGLANMRHRTEAIGASLQIDSRQGAGTCIRVQLPYPTKEGSVCTIRGS
ncbi:MAG TPA: two-component regulator propeller domain-containing protein [Candidatus Binatia bacterium]|jgi:signal transduction histidine kinase/ligand-binding sensor domain-containing protein|nr:two-component regulator propeller domain-containing protein [Candidatus Binatia bacterium]